MSRKLEKSDSSSYLSGSAAGLDEIFKSPTDFWGRKRKRVKNEDDSLSLCSVDLGAMKDIPIKKRRMSLAKMQSIANILSPVNSIKKVGNALQRSLSWKTLSTAALPSSTSNDANKPPPIPPREPKRTPSGNRGRRQSTFWHETVESAEMKKFEKPEIERQEAIYELYKSEEDLVEDLKLVKSTYHDSMRKLGILTNEELDQIFGHIHSLVPLHEELTGVCRRQRTPEGTWEGIGQVLLEWVPRLGQYIPYCANQVNAKALLDYKKQDPAVEDFLERCRESPFSRKLDLWSFLDVPRSRLVKYPLMFRNILKTTPSGHADNIFLERAVEIVEQIIAEVDKKTGEAKCRFVKERLDFLDDKLSYDLIDKSQFIICDGVLKNNRGTKLNVFVFDQVLVLSRPATRGFKLKYQVYRQPIPLTELVVEDVLETGKQGSFKSAFSQATAVKNTFKLSFVDSNRGQSHTLQANDEHDKRQWMQSLQLARSNHVGLRAEADGATGEVL